MQPSPAAQEAWSDPVAQQPSMAQRQYAAQTGLNILAPDVTEEARAITSYMPTDDTQLEMKIGAKVHVIYRHASGWTWCETPSGEDAGWVPDSALEAIQSTDLTMDQQESFDPLSMLDPQNRALVLKVEGTAIYDTICDVHQSYSKCYFKLSDDTRMTSLHLACLQGSPEAVEAIAKSNPGVLQSAHAQKDMLTPMHISVLCNHEALVEVLCSLRGDVNAASIEGVRPLHLAALAAPDLIEPLILAGAGLYQTDGKGNTPMHYACAAHKSRDLLEHLTRPVRANYRGVDVLAVASVYGSVEFCCGLVAMGHDPSVMDDRRWNAVTVVTKLGHKDLVDLYMHDKVTRQDMCKRLLEKKEESAEKNISPQKEQPVSPRDQE